MINCGERIRPGIKLNLKISMIRSNLCDYSDAYVDVKGTITIPNTGTAAATSNVDKKIIFKNCAPFINCINEINNAQVDDVRDIDVVMLTYNLI